eukprot:CAMPEP_0116951586 /NCGR_PEP_ID=MMETSP0467-20121206/40209_1 /TAXON_ID=283647 /ORGANISM="Mesodinium pulex, Strain SPMC105" /LENGTH=231 /DNA_ID=CAMNT_0004636663 /DNA_START=218 /DNA_END=913 /DNA_ORIENTATION=+
MSKNILTIDQLTLSNCNNIPDNFTLNPSTYIEKNNSLKLRMNNSNDVLYEKLNNSDFLYSSNFSNKNHNPDKDKVNTMTATERRAEELNQLAQTMLRDITKSTSNKGIKGFKSRIAELIKEKYQLKKQMENENFYGNDNENENMTETENGKNYRNSNSNSRNNSRNKGEIMSGLEAVLKQIMAKLDMNQKELHSFKKQAEWADRDRELMQLELANYKNEMSLRMHIQQDQN